MRQCTKTPRIHGAFLCIYVCLLILNIVQSAKDFIGAEDWITGVVSGSHKTPASESFSINCRAVSNGYSAKVSVEKAQKGQTVVTER